MLNGVFGTMSAIGTKMTGTAAGKQSADMKPMPVTTTMVPTAPVGPKPGSVGQHQEILGESIFGNYVYSSDEVPQATNPSWVGRPPMAGFGEASMLMQGAAGFGAEVPATQFVPATDHWGGHGIFGGRLHRGGYGMNRYGQPIHGFGEPAYGATALYALAGVAALAAVGGGIWWWSKKKKKTT